MEARAGLVPDRLVALPVTAVLVVAVERLSLIRPSRVRVRLVLRCRAVTVAVGIPQLVLEAVAGMAQLVQHHLEQLGVTVVLEER